MTSPSNTLCDSTGQSVMGVNGKLAQLVVFLLAACFIAETTSGSSW